MTERNEEVPVDTTLWCLNIKGPDDVLAVSSRAEAVELASRFNEVMTARFEPPSHPDFPLMWAIPTQWPHDDASHAENLGDLGEYAWLRDPAPTERKVSSERVSALPPVDGLEVVAELNRIIAEEAADFADAAGHAVEAGERPDLWDREVEVSVHTLSQASSVIAGLKEANEALMRERTSLIETKREQIDRLTQDRITAERDAQNMANQLVAAEARVKDLEEVFRINVTDQELVRINNMAVGTDEVTISSRMMLTLVGCIIAARTALKGGSNG